MSNSSSAPGSSWVCQGGMGERPVPRDVTMATVAFPCTSASTQSNSITLSAFSETEIAVAGAMIGYNGEGDISTKWLN